MTEFTRLEWELRLNLEEAQAQGDQEKVRNLVEAIIEIHAASKQPE